MNGYRLTPRADTDVNEIWTYVATRRGNDAADQVENELHAAMQKLAEMPGIGHLREDLADERLRFFHVKGYLIVYRPETKPLEVIHVIHAARDVRAILGYQAPEADDPRSE